MTESTAGEGAAPAASEETSEPKTLPQEQVNKLVGSARVEARSALLKKLGVDSEDDLAQIIEERDTLKQSQMSEIEKATAEADKWRKKYEAEQSAKAAAELANLRASIARSKGLPEELVDRVTGDDEETITADVEKLLPLVGAQQPPPDLGDGTRPPGAGTRSPEEEFVLNQLLGGHHR